MDNSLRFVAAEEILTVEEGGWEMHKLQLGCNHQGKVNCSWCSDRNMQGMASLRWLGQAVAAAELLAVAAPWVCCRPEAVH